MRFMAVVAGIVGGVVMLSAAGSVLIAIVILGVCFSSCFDVWCGMKTVPDEV